MGQHQQYWTRGWITVVSALTAVLVAVVEHSHLQPLTVSALPVLALLGAGVGALIGIVMQIRLRAHIFRTQVWLAGGCWVTWFAVSGWTQGTTISLAAGTAAFAALSPLFSGAKQQRVEQGPAPATPGADPQRLLTPLEQRWQDHIRHNLSGKPVRVTRVEPWENPRDGQRVYLDLPAGMSWRLLAAPEFLENLQASCRLPNGCLIRPLEGDHQGSAMLDVMLRDCLIDEVMLEEDTTPVSINDAFTVMTTPRGEELEVCLREDSMVLGGTVGSGKTTLLHRIIFRLARCVDALIWVVDLNGGGVAEPWISPWARDLAHRPVVDWVADSEESAAVMLTVASAIAKDRKTSQVATRRKRAANTTILPVDRSLPAIIVLTDEGGEVRQAASLLGQIAAAGISRLTQIGRAEAVRVIMSVLRGTSDLLDKAMRVNAAIRLCLRMQEEDEYGHVLGMNPPRTRLTHRGSGYLIRAADSRPIFGRTVNVLLDAMERHAIATADLRPDLDDRARYVAARIRVIDVLEGREPSKELLESPIMQDVEAGRAYEGRWDWYAHKLAEMRGEEPASDPEPPKRTTAVAAATAPVVQPGSALAALTAAVGTPVASTTASAAEAEATRTAVNLDDQGAVDEAAHQLLDNLNLTAKLTARDLILAILADAYPEAMGSKQICDEMTRRRRAVDPEANEYTRTYVQDVLKTLKVEGAVYQEKDGQPYTLPAKV